MVPSAPSRSRSRSAQQGEETNFLGFFQRDLTKYVKQEFITNQNDHNTFDMYNTIYRCVYQLFVASTLYKSKFGNYERKLKAENQNLKKELEQVKEQSTKFDVMIDKLEEKVALFESKSLQLKHELSGVRNKLINSRKDLKTQRFSFEQQLEAETCRFQSRIDSLEKQNVDDYNSGLLFCYD